MIHREKTVEIIKRYRWPIVGVGLVVAVVGFLLFRPDKLFVDDVVDESLADAFGAPAVAAAESSTTAPPPATTAPSSGDLGDTVPATTAAPPTTAAPEPTGPVTVSDGAFFGIDHRAEGTATIYESEGRYVLRFEDDTDIQNGPDLFVWLVAADDYDGGDPGEYIDLGKLKGNIGGQNYELPPEYNPEVHEFVLIWCKRFSTPFAGAPLA